MSFDAKKAKAHAHVLTYDERGTLTADSAALECGPRSGIKASGDGDSKCFVVESCCVRRGIIGLASHPGETATWASGS